MAIQDMANLFKFIPFTTSSIPIRFILFNFPLKNFIQRLQMLLPSQLFAMTLKLVLIQIQSIRMEKYLLKNKPANFCILYIMSTNIFFSVKEKTSRNIISLYNGLSGQKDGSSEKQSITNFFPIDFHNKRGINVESDMREESMIITNIIIKKKKKRKTNHNINAFRVTENNSKCSKCHIIHSTPHFHNLQCN